MRIGARGKFIDFWSRAVTGPICFESDFDKRVYWPKLKKITEKWGIKYDPDHMVPCDDEMLDRLWQAAARSRAEGLLARLNLPERLWHIAPATFSGGEQQRVNIARGFIRPSPILLLDEPTASLDGANRQVVIDLIREVRGNGAAIVGIFHDDVAREAVADSTIPVRRP